VFVRHFEKLHSHAFGREDELSGEPLLRAMQARLMDKKSTAATWQ
tara:strand:+ start:700 stop:834 length:135 start_codon:yes stop_codon:yes gene_type:complete